MQPLRTFSSLIILFAALACTRSGEIYQPQSFDELPGHTMALMEGSVQADFAEQHFRDKGVNLVYYPGFTDGMIAVRQGRADVLFANLLMTYNDAFKEQHLKICKVVDEIVADTGYGIKKGNEELKSELNTFLDNVTFGPVRILGKERSEAEDEAMKILHQVGLGDKAGAMPSSLSGGQKQRAAIARCLSMRPDCILFDEPTSALDPTSELDYRLIFRTLVKGLDHKVLDNSEELSLSIVRGMSRKITETVTPEGLVIEIS